MATRKIIAETTPGTAGAAAAPARSKRATASTHSSAHSRKTAATSEADEVSTPSMVQPEVPIAHDDIARLAYAIWEARGRTGGSPAEDWQRAEAELRKSR